MFFDEQEEYLKRDYLYKEYPYKINLLTEYYKFHQDIPRLFMLPTTNVLNNYHDKKRRIEYFRIAQLIEEENKQNPKRPQKGIVGDKPEKKSSYSDSSDENSNDEDMIGKVLLNEISSFVNRGTATQAALPQKDLQTRTSKEATSKRRQIMTNKHTNQEEISLTIIELNKKLDQITHQNQNFDESMQAKDLTNTNLDDFLRFINKQVGVNQVQVKPKIKPKIELKLDAIDFQQKLKQIQGLYDQQYSSRVVKNALNKLEGQKEAIMPQTSKNQKVNDLWGDLEKGKIKKKFDLNLKNLDQFSNKNIQIDNLISCKSQQKTIISPRNQPGTPIIRHSPRGQQSKPSTPNSKNPQQLRNFNILKTQTATQNDTVQSQKDKFLIYVEIQRVEDNLGGGAQTHRAFDTPIDTQGCQNPAKKIQPCSANKEKIQPKASQNSKIQFFSKEFQAKKQLITPKHSTQSSNNSSNNQPIVNNFIHHDESTKMQKTKPEQSSARNSFHNNVNIKTKPQTPGHKHAKSDIQKLTLNLLNLKPEKSQKDSTNCKKTPTIKTPISVKNQAISFKQKSYDMQQDMLTKLSSFNFAHNFLKEKKKKTEQLETHVQADKATGILQSERGTNSTYKMQLVLDWVPKMQIKTPTAETRIKWKSKNLVNNYVQNNFQ